MDCNIKEEVWKDVIGFEGLYQVSNKGNVRSLDHTKEILSRYGTMMTKKFKGKMLSINDNGYGYKTVQLGRSNRRYVHRLVAEAFIPNPHNEKEINHKDEDKSNNSIDNLEWCDRLYNLSYGSRLEKFRISVKGRVPWNKGIKHTEETKRKISLKAKERYKDKTKHPRYKGKTIEVI